MNNIIICYVFSHNICVFIIKPPGSSELLCVRTDGCPVSVPQFWPQPATLSQQPSFPVELAFVVPLQEMAFPRCSFYL